MGRLELFEDLVSRPDEEVDLARAALLIAQAEYSDLDSGRYLVRLDELGVSVRRRLGPAPSAERARGALNQLLYEDQGFRGNTRDYYDPRNSFLNEVLDRRTGIPISLSAVYIEVGRRAGVALEGVALPGHFVVRLLGSEGALVVDPFHSGMRLTEADCQRRLDRIYEGRMKLEPSMLEACGPRAMLTRMLRNLKVIYAKRGDLRRALRIVEMMLRVAPDAAEELRDRGLLHAALDCYAWAARDLEGYLVRSPDARDRAEVQAKIADLGRKAARLN